MQTKTKFTLNIAVLFLFLFTWNQAGYSQMSSELKQFLESRNFSELINTYKRDKISLFTEGKRAKVLAARSYTVEKGYRCQIFAGAQKESADRVAGKMRALQMDSVYVIYSNDNLYKVQMGNFDNRRDAEVLLDKLKYAKVEGAWIVEAEVHRPKSPADRQQYQQAQQKQQELEERPGFYYAIQVFASSDSIKAFQLKDVLQRDMKQPVEVVSQESNWKVLVGQFVDRSSAEEFLKVLKRDKFSDAWITQVVSTE